jgi:protein ImuA
VLSGKQDIIDQLQRELLLLQRHKTPLHALKDSHSLAFLSSAFPGSTFPLGAVHEFICAGKENLAATGGFVSGLLSSLMKKEVVTIWISSNKTIFPPAFKAFGLDPDHVIFIQLQKEKELLWATEEALKCKGLAAVVCELPELSFTSSRRFQLAVEQSAVTGFILRINPRKLTTTACVARWQISSLPSEVTELPGVGFPKWNVELLKVRNGKPGSWQVEWAAGKFRLNNKVAKIEFVQQLKTG